MPRRAPTTHKTTVRRNHRPVSRAKGGQRAKGEGQRGGPKGRAKGTRAKGKGQRGQAHFTPVAASRPAPLRQGSSAVRPLARIALSTPGMALSGRRQLQLFQELKGLRLVLAVALRPLRPAVEPGRGRKTMPKLGWPRGEGVCARAMQSIFPPGLGEEGPAVPRAIWWHSGHFFAVSPWGAWGGPCAKADGTAGPLAQPPRHRAPPPAPARGCVCGKIGPVHFPVTRRTERRRGPSLTLPARRLPACPPGRRL
jgi:hypothetical protein